MNNPDYPTNTGSFLMHTYQLPNQTQSSFYYNGMNCAPSMMPGTFQPDSRRNEPLPATATTTPMANAQNPLAPFQALYAQQAGIPQPTQQYQQFATSPISVPVEPNVQPFSSYPPEYTAPQNQFTVTADSRRFDMNAPQTASPWAQPVQNPFAMNAQQTPCPQYINPTADCGAMYTSCNATPVFRRMQQWDNQFTQPQSVAMPVANWSQYIPQSQHQSGPVYAPPALPTTNPEPNQSWSDIARQNFK